MAAILSDDILSKLLCSLCKEYLSCGPIRIHQTGEIWCGRCSTNETTNSLYEKVARFSLFPCINRYEGCNKLLQYQAVAQHERNCKGTRFSCPVCPSKQSTETSLLYLIDHYRTVHEEYFLKEPKFLIDTNKMSESIYLYCDNYNNCLFFIIVGCTQDRVFLNACIPGKNKIVQRFRLNNVLVEPNKVMLCTSLGESEHQHLEVKTPEVINGRNEGIWCEFFYEIGEKSVPVVAMDLNHVDEETTTWEWTPKLYLDSKIFPGGNKYSLSPCKSKLVNKNDNQFSIKLKCDCCERYFWNDNGWITVNFNDTQYKRGDQYGLFGSEYKDELICVTCYTELHFNQSLFKPIATPIFKLRVYCRYDCGSICRIWDLNLHEKKCDLNLEKNPDEFVKKCFGENFFDTDDIFVNGNIIRPFLFEVEFYSFAVFGRQPKISGYKDVTSQEKVMYLVTDDGLRCRVYYKYAQGDFLVRVEHDYDKTKYLVTIRWGGDGEHTPMKEIMFLEKSEYHSIWSTCLGVREQPDGIAQFIHTPCFIVIIKKIPSSCIITG